MRAFPVVTPSGQKYWTVLDDDLEVVPVADHWLRNLRFGRDRAELTTKAYAGGVALYLRWCGGTGRSWPDAGRDLGLFMVWLKYTPTPRDGVAVVVQPGPGADPVRCERRINRVLVAVRGLLSYAVSAGEAPRPRPPRHAPRRPAPARRPTPKDPPVVTTAMNDGRQADTERRRTRVTSAITTARREGSPLTASAIARAARVDRTFLYRHRDLLDALHTAAYEPATPSGTGPTVTSASLQADLANAGARSARLAARVQQLEERLSKALGEKIWRASGLGPPADVAELNSRITRLEQSNVELTRALEERQAELEAARAANRDLTRALNHKS